MAFHLRGSTPDGQTIEYWESYKVMLEKKLVGEIKAIYDHDEFGIASVIGYRYFPKDSKEGGKMFTGLGACKKSIEGP